MKKIKSLFLAIFLLPIVSYAQNQEVMDDEVGNTYGHGVALRRVIEKDFTRCTGRRVTKYFYEVMAPADGLFRNVSAREIQYKYMLTQFKK